MAHGDRSPLGVDPDTMRTLGYRRVDMLVARITGPAGPVVRAAAPEVLHERLALPPPETATAFGETWRAWSATCCRSSSEAAASGRANRCARTAPLSRSKSLPLPSWSS